MDNNIKKVINLVKKTGDRLVVYDPNNTDNIFVIMSIAEYEKLIIKKSEVRNLTEDELLDKINRDIAIWKSEQNNEDSFIKPLIKDSEFFADNREEYPAQDKFGWNDEYDEDDNWGRIDDWRGIEEAQMDNFAGKTDDGKYHWNIPSERKESAEEIIEEDRQYLEEINN